MASEINAASIEVARTTVSKLLHSDVALRAKALSSMGADAETIAMISQIDALITDIKAKNGDVIPMSWGLGCGGIAC